MRIEELCQERARAHQPVLRPLPRAARGPEDGGPQGLPAGDGALAGGHGGGGGAEEHAGGDLQHPQGDGQNTRISHR